MFWKPDADDQRLNATQLTDHDVRVVFVRGDRWRSMPYVAAVELRRALEFLRVADPDTQAVAGRIVNLLSEQGFLDYRDLLPPARAFTLIILCVTRRSNVGRATKCSGGGSERLVDEGIERTSRHAIERDDGGEAAHTFHCVPHQV